LAVANCPRDLLQTIVGHFAIRMDKPQYVTGSCLGARIHLHRSPSAGCQHPIAQLDHGLSEARRIGSIHNDYLGG
jgi:hypothetical protein